MHKMKRQLISKSFMNTEKERLQRMGYAKRRVGYRGGYGKRDEGRDHRSKFSPKQK
jgi:hypothetical protein